MVSINTNMSASMAANSIARNERALSTTMERLSTGNRINSAKDDAAGLAITSKMDSQVKGLSQAVRNANDAISMIQVAEGSMKEVTNMFQRMRELAVQAISDSNTAGDRAALNNEYKQLSGEIKRIASNTQWNGTNILDDTIGTKGVSTFQIGANAGQTIKVDFGNLATNRVTAVAAQPSAAVYEVSTISVGASGKISLGDAVKTISIDSATIVDGSAAGSADVGKTDELITAIQAKTQVASVYSVDAADGIFSGATSTSDIISFTFEGKTATLPLWTVTPAVTGVYSSAVSTSNLANTGQVVVSDGTATVTLAETASPYATVAALATAIQGGTNYSSLQFTVDANSAGNALEYTYKTGAAVAGSDEPTIVVDSRSIKGVYSSNLTESQATTAGAVTFSDGTNSITVSEKTNTYSGLEDLAATIRDATGYGALNYTITAGTDKLIYTAKTGGAIGSDPTISIDNRNDIAVYSTAVTSSNVAAAGQVVIADGTTTITVTEPASAYADLNAMVTAIQGDSNYSALNFTVSAGSDALVFTAKASGVVATDPTVTINGRSTTGAFSTDVSTANVADAGQIVVGDGTTTVTVAEPGSAYANLGAMVSAIQGESNYSALNYTVSAGTDELVFTAKTAGDQADPTISINSRAKTAVYSTAVTSSNVAAAGQVVIADGTTTITVTEPASAYADLNAMVTAIQGDSNYSALNFTVSAGSDALVFTAKASGVVATDPTVTINGRSTTGAFSTDVSTANVADAGQIVVGDGTTTVTVAEPGSAYANLGAMVSAIQGESNYSALNYTVSAGTDELVFTAKTAGDQADPTISINSRSPTAVYSTAVSAGDAAAAGRAVLTDGATTITVASPATPYSDLDSLVTAIQADANYSAFNFTVSEGSDAIVFTAKTFGVVAGDPSLTIDGRATAAVYDTDISAAELSTAGQVTISDGTTTVVVAETVDPHANVEALATAIQNNANYDSLLFTVSAGTNALNFNYKAGGVVSATPTIDIDSRAIKAVYSTDVTASDVANAGQIVIGDGTTTVTIAQTADPHANLAELITAITQGTNYDSLLFTVSAGTNALNFNYKSGGVVSALPTIAINSRPTPAVYSSDITTIANVGSVVIGDGTNSVTLAQSSNPHSSVADLATAIQGTPGHDALLFQVSAGTNALDFTYETGGVIATPPTVVVNSRAVAAVYSSDYNSSDLADTGEVVVSDGTTTVTLAKQTNAPLSVTELAEEIQGSAGYNDLLFTVTAGTDALEFTYKTGGAVSTAPTITVDSRASTGTDIATAPAESTAGADSADVAGTVAASTAGENSADIASTVAATTAGENSADIGNSVLANTAGAAGAAGSASSTATTTAGASGASGGVTTSIDIDTADVDGTTSTVTSTVDTTTTGAVSGSGGNVTSSIDIDTADVDGTSSTVTSTVGTTTTGAVSGSGGNVTSSIDTDTADVDGTSSTVASTVSTTTVGASGTSGGVTSSIDTDTADVDGTSSTVASAVSTTTVGASGASGGVASSLAADTAGVDAGAGAVSTSVTNTTAGADDASQATYSTTAGAISALNAALDSQGIFFTAAAAADTGSGNAGITFTADDGSNADGYVGSNPTVTISSSIAAVTERTMGSDAYSELGFTVAAGESGGIKMSYKTVGAVSAPTLNNAGSALSVSNTTAGVDAAVTPGSASENTAARGDISFAGQVSEGDVITMKLNNTSYASFTLDSSSANAINSGASHNADVGGANDATGGPVTSVNAVAGRSAIYTMALTDGAASSLADGFAISDGTTTVTVADMSSVSTVADVISAIQNGSGYASLTYTVSSANGGLTFVSKTESPIASAAQPTGTSLTTVENTVGAASVAGVMGSDGMTFTGNLGLDVGTITASVVNGKLRVVGDTVTDSGSAPTFAMSNIEVSRGIHAAAGGTDITTRGLATTALEVLDNAIQGVNNTRASMGASMSRLEYASDNLQNIAQNTQAARSRVLDADYAKETTELARNQII